MKINIFIENYPMKNMCVTFLVAMLFVATSCHKEDHSIRFKNQYHENIHNLNIGGVDFGTVNANNMSAYKPIQTGKFNITGSTKSGGQLSGTGSISGKGKHQWSVILMDSGFLVVDEDQ